MTTTGWYGDDDGPWVVAHRGGAGLGPENRLETFARSASLGVRYFETDARVSADGVAVAFHDDVLDRVTDQRGPVRTRSAHRVCVAGGWDGWLAAAVEGCGPRLSRTLGWRSLAALVWCARAGVPPPSAVASGGFAHLPWRFGAASVLADPWLARRVVEAAGDLGIRVLAWTVDEPAALQRLSADGVAGVITDRPDLALAVLGRPPAVPVPVLVRAERERGDLSAAGSR